MRESIELTIGLSDSEFLSSERKEGFIVRIMAWNAKIIEISFENVIAINDRDPGDLSDFIQINEPSELLRDALAREYTKLPVSHPYKHYAFLDLYDNETLNIIATGFQVKVIERESDAA